MKNILSLALVFVYAAIVVPQAQAATVPNFPLCSNPQGTVKVSYDNGVHGIVGRTEEYRGSDKVYQLSNNDTLMQCFCADNGQGIQTNWWKANSLSETDINVLKNEGWIYVANGALWGLDNGPYVAKNNDYNCKATGTGGGDTLGTTSTGSVLGLATTGNIVTIYALTAVGAVSVALGLLLRKKA